MKSFTFGELIALGSLLLGTSTAIIGAVFWYANNEKKKYGLERDFAHLRNNQKQIQDGISLILREQDHRFNAIDLDITEIKSVLKMQKN